MSGRSFTKGTLAIIVLICAVYFAAPIRGAVNSWLFGIHKVDDATSYETIRTVEDTCRAMLSSYETDVQTYKQFAGAAENEKRNWAEQARMRANKTASTYNNYILKNSFVWRENIPSDIAMKLDFVGEN